MRASKLMIGLGAALLIGAGLAWLFVPAYDEAFALLKISRRPPSVLAHATDSPEEFATYKRTQAQLMLSNGVLVRALGKPEISKLSIIPQHEDNVVDWLKNQLVIQFPDDAEILRVSMQAANPDEARQVVDAVVEKYLTEIVQHDRDLRNEHERKLLQTYETFTNEVKTQTDTLHKLEALHKTSGTEAAQVRRKIELERLGEIMAQRNKVANQMMENSMQIMLAEATRDAAETAPDAQAPATPEDPATRRSLLVLNKQKEYLETLYKTADENLAEQAKVLANLDEFNVNVQAKLEELRAWKLITSELRSELDRIKVERLAPERILKLDEAVLTSNTQEVTRKQVGVSVAATLGLGLIALGVIVRRRRKA